MAVRTVTFDGARLNQVQDYTGWSNYGGSGAGGAAEAPLAYQNGIAANRKQSGSSLGGIQLNNASSIDMTAANRDLWFCKVYVSDAFDLNVSEGVRVGIGSASNASRSYNLAGTTAPNDRHTQYPAQGGYILCAIDPAVAFWAIASSGSINLASIQWFGVQGAWIVGTAKAENIAMDAIDIGLGLYLSGGTGADPEANFVDYVEDDQNIVANRWGCVAGQGSNVNAWCRLRAGGAIEFFDTTSIVSFKDGYYDNGQIGVLHELNNAASTWTMGATLIGEGKSYNSGALNTRPDYTVSGTTLSGSYNLTGTLRNFRNVTLNSAVVADGANVECQDLTLGGAEFKNGIFRANAASAAAVCDDAVFGVASGFHDTTVQQAGAGHAFAITGDVTLTNMNWSGFGADGSNDAAILVNTTNPVTITVSGGQTPTYRTIGSGNVTISNPKILTMQFDFIGPDPANFEWRLYEDSGVAGEVGTVELAGNESKTTMTDETYNYTYVSDQPVVLQVIADGFEEGQLYFTLGNADQTQKITLQPEENI